MTTRARELTPRGAGGVSVVEFTGPAARAHVLGIGAPADLAIGEARLARLVLAGGLVDEALVLALAPDRVEVHLHGSPSLVRAALASCAAFESPRSLEERASARLPSAPCEGAARILLDQSEGALRVDLERLAAQDLGPARAFAAELLRRGRIARFALDPARIVLAGPVNAGKSTLFNALAGEMRALVADEPGTTRDVLVADALLEGWPARVFDTAGERGLAEAHHADSIEAEGQLRARRLRVTADLVLWLVPAGSPPPPAPPGALILATHSDRVAAPPQGAIAARPDPRGARRRVGELLRARFDLPREPWTPGAGVPFEAEWLSDLHEADTSLADPRVLARAWLAEA